MDADQERIDTVSEQELVREVAEGETTHEQIDEQLDARMRRKAAERNPQDLPDSTDVTTAGGPGSGQGMAKEQTGQDPDIPPERGIPRTSKDPNSPYGGRESAT